MKYKLRRILAKIALALALGLVVLVILDGYNPLMAFLSSLVSKIYICLTCACCVLLAALCLAAGKE